MLSVSHRCSSSLISLKSSQRILLSLQFLAVLQFTSYTEVFVCPWTRNHKKQTKGISQSTSGNLR